MDRGRPATGWVRVRRRAIPTQGWRRRARPSGARRRACCSGGMTDDEITAELHDVQVGLNAAEADVARLSSRRRELVRELRRRRWTLQRIGNVLPNQEGKALPRQRVQKIAGPRPDT